MDLISSDCCGEDFESFGELRVEEEVSGVEG